MIDWVIRAGGNGSRLLQEVATPAVGETFCPQASSIFILTFDIVLGAQPVKAAPVLSSHLLPHRK